jgi:hypothetical protein
LRAALKKYLAAPKFTSHCYIAISSMLLTNQ